MQLNHVSADTGELDAPLAFAAVLKRAISPGQTAVQVTRRFSRLTDFKFCGSMPSAFRIVGATCEVATGVLRTPARSSGFETMRPTLVSPKLKPPCSAFFFVEAV